MKQILKIYGMPRTGTNVLQLLLALNFKTYVSNIGEHGVHYLGWKHGVPPSDNVIKHVKRVSNELPLFVFTNREYNTWSEAIKQRHQNTYEFLERFSNKDVWFYNTPVGFEIYKDDLDFYTQRQNYYKEYCNTHKDTSIMIDFEDLKDKQTEVVLKIADKFNLELTTERDKVINVHKYIDCSGQIIDSLK
jgi:hypothetical protein